MEHTWGTPETQPPEPPRTEYGYLAVGAAALTAAITFCTVDESLVLDFSRGIYSILTGLFVVGGVGWIVRSGDTRRRKALTEAGAKLRAGQVDFRDQLAELTSAVQRLESSARVVHLPQQRANGHRYASQAVVGGPDNDTVAVSRTGLDADTIAAARSVAKQLLDGDAG